jgi:hypothetical protein
MNIINMMSLSTIDVTDHIMPIIIEYADMTVDMQFICHLKNIKITNAKKRKPHLEALKKTYMFNFLVFFLETSLNEKSQQNVDVNNKECALHPLGALALIIPEFYEIIELLNPYIKSKFPTLLEIIITDKLKYEQFVQPISQNILSNLYYNMSTAFPKMFAKCTDKQLKNKYKTELDNIEYVDKKTGTLLINFGEFKRVVKKWKEIGCINFSYLDNETRQSLKTFNYDRKNFLITFNMSKHGLIALLIKIYKEKISPQCYVNIYGYDNKMIKELLNTILLNLWNHLPHKNYQINELIPLMLTNLLDKICGIIEFEFESLLKELQCFYDKSIDQLFDIILNNLIEKIPNKHKQDIVNKLKIIIQKTLPNEKNEKDERDEKDENNDEESNEFEPIEPWVKPDEHTNNYISSVDKWLKDRIKYSVGSKIFIQPNLDEYIKRKYYTS